ncbi:MULTISPECIES: carbohydrate ABC transporter permease [unclassified Rathayibacter]|uniref:carbohydrate ABC transporter permease n=1 Tax=unclassified Rathayibacter TaxID=2609250 RepID=UPI000F4B9BF6|nr:MULTISPECIES: ABC transporter permease subunit [unclassified Rathayibacter]
MRFPGRNLLFLLALATMMIPVQAIMVAQFKLVTGLQIYGPYWSVILPGAAAAFGIFLARQFFLSIPEELIEAARIDGAGHLRVFLQIVLPLSKPLIAVLPMVLLFLAFQRYFVQGFARSGIR